MDRLSIILPTCGRETLPRTFKSIWRQIGPDDEVIVVSDGPNSFVKGLCDQYDDRFYYSFHSDPKSIVGQAQRNYGLTLATKDYITWIGDDDVYVPDAFESIKTAIRENPGKLFMFRWHPWQYNGILWRENEPKLYVGNVGDHPFVHPNIKEKFGTFTVDKYTGDFDFIQETVANFGGEQEIIWDKQLIAVCRPERFGR